MTQEQYQGSPFSDSQADLAGMQEDMDEPGMEIEEDLVTLETALMETADTVLVTPDSQVLVDGSFVFPLDYGWMNLLVWRPAFVGERLKGTYAGEMSYQWSDEDESTTQDYQIVRTGGLDRLVPSWSAVVKAFRNIPVETEVLLIFGGTNQLKNGRTYNRILVGANVKTNNPLVD